MKSLWVVVAVVDRFKLLLYGLFTDTAGLRDAAYTGTQLLRSAKLKGHNT